MAPLFAFQRKWNIASDDFVFPCFIDALIRITWLLAGCIIYWQHETSLINCTDGHFMRIYMLGNFVVLLLTIFGDFFLVQHSMKGSITEVHLREQVPAFLYVRLTLEIPELGWNIMGTVFIYAKSWQCSLQVPEAIILIKALIIWNWIIIIIMIVSVALVFDPSESTANRLSYAEADYERFENGILHGTSTGYTKMWERRCRWLLCSCPCRSEDSNSRNAFKEVGKIMGFLFEDSDLVASDVAAGLILLHLKNQADANARSEGNSPILRQPQNFEESTSMTEIDEWLSPATVSHYMKYSLGSYGWPWFLVAHRTTGLCHLWRNIICCGCCRSIAPYSVEGDNCCYCHTSALKHTAQIEDQDLLYASFHNEVFKSPFTVSIDHSMRSIVVAIRGTMSLRDALTDLAAEAKSLEFCGLPSNFKGHSGMIQSAKNILEKLENLKLLHKATAAYPTYSLVITGHSLGAGCACILAMMMKKKFPNLPLKCYAFSPPGGLLSEDAAKYCEDFVISVIVGDDIVSRLSLPAFEKFKTQLKETLKIPVPKYRILVGGCFYFLIGGAPNLLMAMNGQQRDDENRRSDTNLLQPNREPTQYHTYVSLAEVQLQLQRSSLQETPMFAPGKIMHITEKPIFVSRPDLSDHRVSRYEYRFAERYEFCEIKVSIKMAKDHYPDNVYLALLDIANQSTVSGSPFYSVI